MAKKTKTAKAKKQPKSQAAPVNVLAALRSKIIVVSSIECSPKMKAKFQNAVRSNVNGNVNISFDDDIGYDPAQLGTHVHNASSDNTVGMIVTLGGLITVTAAINPTYNASKPFISLIGGTPSEITLTVGANNFYGAVSLESYAMNAARVAHLIKPPRNFLTSQITLLYNPLSIMSKQEIIDWGTICPGGLKLAKSDNDESTYGKAFSAITTAAVVVSADPMFQNHRNALIKAANESYKYVCYPLFDYGNKGGNHHPAPGNATLHGPNLGDAISTLGEMAAEVLNSGAPSEEGIVRVGAPIDV